MLEGNATTLCGRERPGNGGGIVTMPSEVMCSYEGACSTEIPAMSECKCSSESGCIEIGKGNGHWRSGRRLHLMAIANNHHQILRRHVLHTHTHGQFVTVCVCCNLS